MCYGCWERYGSPKLGTPKVKEAVKLVDRVYEEVSCVGGPLHIQFDDWNIEDGYFKEDTLDLEVSYWKGWKTDYTEEQIELCREAYLVFKALTLEERASALGNYEEY